MSDPYFVAEVKAAVHQAYRDALAEKLPQHMAVWRAKDVFADVMEREPESGEVERLLTDVWLMHRHIVPSHLLMPKGAIDCGAMYDGPELADSPLLRGM